MERGAAESERAGKFLQGLDPELAEQIKGDFFDLASRALAEALPVALSQMVRRSGYSEEVAGLTQLLAAKSGDSVETVLKKALNLYGLALDAHDAGNRLAILNQDDEIVREIIGIQSVEEQTLPVS